MDFIWIAYFTCLRKGGKGSSWILGMNLHCLLRPKLTKETNNSALQWCYVSINSVNIFCFCLVWLFISNNCISSYACNTIKSAFNVSSVSTGKDGTFKVSSVSPVKDWWSLTSLVPDTQLKSKEAVEFLSQHCNKVAHQAGTEFGAVWSICLRSDATGNHKCLSDTCNQSK